MRLYLFGLSFVVGALVLRWAPRVRRAGDRPFNSTAIFGPARAWERQALVFDDRESAAAKREAFERRTLREKLPECNESSLKGVNIIFDGSHYANLHGEILGINKMWLEILPHMGLMVSKFGGRFTHCASAYQKALKTGGFTDESFSTTIPNTIHHLGCGDLQQAVDSMVGERKIIFSSYYKSVKRHCYVLPVYDMIPEHVNIPHGPESQYWPRIENTLRANHLLSISSSTTQDLAELYAVNPEYVTTSPNRVSPHFKPATAHEIADFKHRHKHHKALHSHCRLPPRLQELSRHILGCAAHAGF